MTDNHTYLWVRVGDAGEYADFDDLDDAIDYLNELCVGKVTDWVDSGFETQNYHGHDNISLYYGDSEGDHIADIGGDDRQYIERNLEHSEL